MFTKTVNKTIWTVHKAVTHSCLTILPQKNKGYMVILPTKLIKTSLLALIIEKCGEHINDLPC